MHDIKNMYGDVNIFQKLIMNYTVNLANAYQVNQIFIFVFLVQSNFVFKLEWFNLYRGSRKK